MTFDDFFLHERVFKALAETPFTTPTPVQCEAIPAALDQKDLVVSAKTGSGKTAAFLLPTISHLLNTPKKNSGTRVVILEPTRELANQVIKQVELFSKFTFFKSLVLTGGASYQEQGAMLRKDPEIIVATPGRLSEHLEKGSLALDDLDTLILDEADRMLDMGFGDEVKNIINFCPDTRQTLLFSATLNQKGLKDIIQALMQSPEYITVDKTQDQHENITQQTILSDDDKLKQKQTDWLLEHEDFTQAIIFTNTKTKANQLYSYLCYRRHKAGVLEGDMMQDERNHIMARFKQKHINVLVATDVAARGLDIAGIDLVINFDVPRSGDDYVHRIGRTGRAGSLGTAITFICQSEFNLMASIERYLKINTERRVIDSLKSSFSEPKKLRNNGSAFGKKRPKKSKKKSFKGKAKATRNAKPSKNTKTPAKNKTIIGDGSAPLKRK